MQNEKVTLQTVEREGTAVDITVAAARIEAGEVIMRVPGNLVVTLDRVFEDGAVAELLTTNKLSELACLTLYLSYGETLGGVRGCRGETLGGVRGCRGETLGGVRGCRNWPPATLPSAG